MSGYGCYHSLPARQRYEVDGNWNLETDLRPTYSITPLETDAIARLRFDVRSLNSDIAVITMYNPEEHVETLAGAGVEVLFSKYSETCIHRVPFQYRSAA